MSFTKKTYVAGPRMGQNNTMNGIDASLMKKKKKTSRKKKK
jgi:hypothetical protein